MKMSRKLRKQLRQTDAVETKARNTVVKSKERARRGARMIAKVKAGSLPYPPPVMSWLSRQLSKPSGTITPKDIKLLLR